MKPGDTLTLTFKWTNSASAGYADGVFQLQLLSPQVAFKGGSARLKPRRQAGSEPQYDPATNTVAWTRLAVAARAQLTFRVRVKVSRCDRGPTLAFQASAYLLDPNSNDPTPLCVQDVGVVVVRTDGASGQRVIV